VLVLDLKWKHKLFDPSLTLVARLSLARRYLSHSALRYQREVGSVVLAIDLVSELFDVFSEDLFVRHWDTDTPFAILGLGTTGCSIDVVDS